LGSLHWCTVMTQATVRGGARAQAISATASRRCAYRKLLCLVQGLVQLALRAGLPTRNVAAKRILIGPTIVVFIVLTSRLLVIAAIHVAISLSGGERA
jgi:hypothetical protein